MRLDRVSAALATINTPVEDAKQRKLRAQILTGRAIEHLDLALDHPVGLRRLRVRLGRSAAAGDRPARRRPDDARRRLGASARPS